MSVRRIPPKHRGITGMHAWGPGEKSIPYESALECDFVTLMSFDPDVAAIDSQPVRISLIEGIKTPSYTPDYLVAFRGRRRSMLVEVKYADDLIKHRKELKHKFAAARRHAKAQGWLFKIWTEKEIRTLRLKSAKFLLPYKRQDADAGICARLLHHLDAAGTMTATCLIGACFKGPTERGRGLHALWVLAATGRIRADINTCLPVESEVSHVAKKR